MLLMLKVRAKTFSGALAAGAATVMLAGGPAAAADFWVTTSDPWGGGYAKFEEYGEVVTVCDNRSDGLRARAELVWIDSSASHYLWVEDTNGTGNDCARLNASVGEGVSVSVTVCLKDGANGTKQWCQTGRGTA
ncbi:hypothetical protein [Streptomyces sp. MJP52]|uniref:hypothetical protein n=1 Tax=Streptomyces sp. MJP52 TaxID=2940555 RepID=UPI002473A83B|nr:hypothetical protein [Streptomyces sp. MJP52]MDH6227425.1 hypothetical protein [Streptomyces sp. MJP52]